MIYTYLDKNLTALKFIITKYTKIIKNCNFFSVWIVMLQLKVKISGESNEDTIKN